MDELKRTLAEIKAKLETVKSEGEKLAVLETAVSNLKAQVEAMPKIAPERLIFRDGQFVPDSETGPYIKAVMAGRAKGWSLQDLWVNRPGDETIKDWQNKGSELYLASMAWSFAKQVPFKEAYGALVQSKGYKDWKWETEQLAKALSTGGSATGSEFVPTEFARDLIERVILGLRVAALHRRITIPRSPFELPAMVTSLPKGFKVSERTSDNLFTEANKIRALTPGTRRVTWTAQGVGGLSIFSTEFDEDSIVPAAEFAQMELVAAIQNAQETAVINGSEDATHPDNDVHTDAITSELPERLWDGYRQHAVRPGTDITLDMGGAVTVAKVRQLRSLMGRYGANPSNLAYVTSIKTLLMSLMSLPEVLTLDKLGPNATVLTGQLASFDGSPVVVSDFARDNVSATGFNTSGGPNDKSTIEIVYRPGLVFGDVRGLRVEQLRWSLTEQIVVVGKMRTQLQDIFPSTTEGICAMGINI